MTKHYYRTLRPLTADPSDFSLHNRKTSTATSYTPPSLPSYQTPSYVAYPQETTEMNQVDTSFSLPGELGEVSLTVLNDSLEDEDCLGLEHRDNSSLTSGGWCPSHDTSQAEACLSQANMAAPCGSSEEEEQNLSIKRKREDFRLSVWDTSSDSGTDQ